jgi:hypothetical protein
MAICKSSLFGNTSQYIKVGNGEFVAIEGSNIFDRLMVSDSRIPYKQLLKGRVILKAGQVNYLLNHLGLGDNATFLAIKATYDSKSVIEEDNYVSYSYYDNPVQILNFAQMMVLTGNSTNRVPQLYLNNPSTKYRVILDIMVGVIDENYSFFNDDLNQNATSFTGIEWTDIKSFVVGESIVIYDKGNPKKALIYFGLPYINSISLNGAFLIIDDESYGSVFLNFIDEYNANQANSLINYVLEHPDIDIESLTSDSNAPIIFWNPTAGASGSYIFNYSGGTSSTGFNTGTHGSTYSATIPLSVGTSSIIYKDKLRDLVIDYISDNRDGVMDIMDSQMIITGTMGEVNSISSFGTYSLTFEYRDLADNNLDNVILNLTIN